MKKTDIAMIVLIAGISMLVTFFVADNISILKVSDKGTKVDTVEKIDGNLDEPSTKMFNSEAINPTVETVIGQSSS